MKLLRSREKIRSLISQKIVKVARKVAITPTRSRMPVLRGDEGMQIGRGKWRCHYPLGHLSVTDNRDSPPERLLGAIAEQLGATPPQWMAALAAHLEAKKLVKSAIRAIQGALPRRAGDGWRPAALRPWARSSDATGGGLPSSDQWTHRKRPKGNMGAPMFQVTCCFR